MYAFKKVWNDESIAKKGEGDVVMVHFRARGGGSGVSKSEPLVDFVKLFVVVRTFR